MFSNILEREKIKWKVVPISEGQLLDVNPEDLIDNGHFRKCNTYRGGGGYDEFPLIAQEKLGEDYHNLQFIVQLFGCNLDCPYCYVTRAGVWGDYYEYESMELVEKFNQTNCTVFHLMGGAPALYMKNWSELIEVLERHGKANWVFHSDLMLTEMTYNPLTLKQISHKRSIYAVNIKGLDSKEYYNNTRKEFNQPLIWSNLDKLINSSLEFYLTFTNVSEDNKIEFWDQIKQKYGDLIFQSLYRESNSISLIQYNALPWVDSVEWGKKSKKNERI